MAFKRHLMDALAVVVLISLVGVSWLAYHRMQAENKSEQWETHSRAVTQKFSDLLSALKDAETGQQGFIITGQPDYLEPYHAGLAASRVHLAELRRLTADDPRQQQRLDVIAPLIAAKFATLEETIVRRETRGFPAASPALAALHDKTLMDQPRVRVAKAQAAEAQLLKVRSAATVSDTRMTLQWVILGGSLGALALLLLFIRLWWELASRQRAQTSLRASEQRLRLATDAAELGIWSWQPDSDRIVWENERPYAILGMARTDAPLTAARFAAEFIHAEDRAAFEKAMQDTAQNGARLFYQGRFHGPDGKLRWIECTGQPGPDGTCRRVLGTVQDITDRKQAEALLAWQAAELATLYATAPVGLFMLDKDLRYVRVNQAMAALNGLPAEQHTGRTLHELLMPELADATESMLRQVLQTGSPVLNFEMHGATLARSNEQQRHWLVSCHPVQAGDGLTRGVHGVVQEITERWQAGEALRQRTAQFETLVNEAPLGVYLVDADLRICQASPIACEAFGNRSDLIGSDVDEILHWVWPPAVADEHVKQFRHTLETGKPYFVREFFDVRFDRKVAEYYEWQINRIPLPDGRHGVVCYFRDISQRVLAQQEISESEERYRSLFNSVDEGFCVIEMIFDDHQKAVDWRYLEVNPSFVALTGIPDIVGKRIRDLVPDHEAYWFEIYGKVVLTGEAIRFVNEAKSLDGRWFDLYAFRLGGPDSCKVAVLFTNITERRQAELALDRLNATLEQRVQARTAELSQANADLQAVAAAKELLQESEERLLTVAENLSEGLVITSIEGEFIHWNRASLEMHGFASLAECLGRLADFTRLVEIKTLAGVALSFDQWPMSRALRGELVHNCELRIRRTDTGVERILSYGGTIVRDSAGKQSAFLIITDITERQQAEVQLRELNDTLERRKDEFLAMLGHELRNPLAALANAAQLLRLQNHEDPLQQQGRAIIERQVRQLKHLVDDLLEVSRIVTGSVRLRLEPVSLGGVVERALETVRALIAQHRHTLEVALTPEPVILQADAARLEQVLVNLLSNAAKYTHDGGQIWLGLEREGNAAVLRVRDTGIGIAPELLPRIFDLFTQAERSLDRSQGGLGIGLSLVQQLVELHGGMVAVHSILGQGSEFVVRLPLILAPLTPLPAPAPDAVLLPEPQAGGCRVLLVDDNVDAAQTLAMLLGITGHAVTLAYDGPSAVQAAINARPDVVLLDIGLPGLDGYEIARRIRQQASLKGVVLLALTGYGQETDRQRSQEAGFDHHLVKPVDFDEIKRILEGIAKKTS